jgi:hypothetical protein
MGAMIVSVRESLLDCVNFKDGFLDDATLGTDSFLVSLGYTGPEITMIRAAFSAMKTLSNIAKGLSTQPATNDFYFDAKHLVGLNI